MSSSVAYRYSYVDLEAQERRALRAEIAVLRQREAGLRAQALSVTSGEAARITLDGFGGNDATDTRAKMATTAEEAAAQAEGRIAAAVLAAEQLLDREIPRCAQEHLDLFRRRLAEVRAAS